jgi:hypothetical protein
MNFIKKVWTDPVWSKVIATFICFAVPAAGLYALVHWWGAVSVFTGRAWNYVTADALIPRWVLCALYVLVAILAARSLQALLPRPKAPERTWRDYTEDEFHFIQWRWKLDASGHPKIIKPFCCACDLELDIDGDNHSLVPHTVYACACGKTNMPFNARPYEVRDRIIKLIERKIRNGEWANAKIR